MRKKTMLLSIAMLAAAGGFAQKFTATYNFNDVTSSSGTTDPTPAPIVTGAGFGGFAAVGASANSNASGRFSFTNWPLGATSGDDLYSSLMGTMNTSEYYEVTISPESGYTLDLDSITFDVRRSGTGIRTYAVRSSVDGFSSDLPATIDPANSNLKVEAGNVFFWTTDAVTSNQNGSKITLGGLNHTGLSTPVTFRFYGFNAEGTAGSFSIDDVAFSGGTNVATSINNDGQQAIINVYPNPSINGFFTVDARNNLDQSRLTVYNLIGKVMLTTEINASSGNTIDLSALENGSYLITIQTDEVIYSQRIIINQ